MKLIIVYTGNGEGKTCAALGHALRAAGHDKKCVMIQFLKGRENIGEYKAQKLLKDYFKIYQFGSKKFVTKVTEKDREMAKKALEFAKELYKKEKPFLLILDEINVAISMGLLKVEEVIEFLNSVKRGIIILTGRNAPRELKEMADIVTEMREIKHDFPKRKAVKGFEW
jgi:cob(I)alamin adenosyltransferase